MKSLVSIPKTLISENGDTYQVYFGDEISSQYPKNSDFGKLGYSIIDHYLISIRINDLLSLLCLSNFQCSKDSNHAK